MKTEKYKKTNIRNYETHEKTRKKHETEKHVKGARKPTSETTKHTKCTILAQENEEKQKRRHKHLPQKAQKHEEKSVSVLDSGESTRSRLPLLEVCPCGILFRTIPVVSERGFT